MDTSKRYMKMCKQSLEIQHFWKPKNGDFFYGIPQDIDDDEAYPEGIYNYLYCDDEYSCVLPRNYSVKKGFTGETDAVFMPRIDDLYQMVLHDTPSELMERFYKWMAGLTVSMKERYQSLEQLWLGFVMETNHSVTWNGKDWEEKE